MRRLPVIPGAREKPGWPVRSAAWSCVLGILLISQAITGPAAGAAGPTGAAGTPGPAWASPPPSIPSPPPAVPPAILVVQLGTAFSPAEIQLGTGQQFLVQVNQDVQTSGLSPAGVCPPGQTAQIDDGLLTLQCTADGGYLYTAERPGSATLLVTVRPSCAPETLCPQWIAEASLRITIT